MTMHYVEVFLNEDALVQLEDEFVDKEDDLRHLVYEPVKTLAKASKMVLLNKQFVCNVYDEEQPRQTGQETIQLEDYDLDKHKIDGDDTWRPENVVADSKPYKIRVGDKTWNLLETYFKIYEAKVSVYNKSLPNNKKDKEKFRAVPAKCYQQILHEALIQPVMQKIDKSIDEELEEDFKLANEGKKDKAAKKKEKRNPK